MMYLGSRQAFATQLTTASKTLWYPWSLLRDWRKARPVHLRDVRLYLWNCVWRSPRTTTYNMFLASHVFLCCQRALGLTTHWIVALNGCMPSLGYSRCLSASCSVVMGRVHAQKHGIRQAPTTSIVYNVRLLTFSHQCGLIVASRWLTSKGKVFYLTPIDEGINDSTRHRFVTTPPSSFLWSANSWSWDCDHFAWTLWSNLPGHYFQVKQ